MDRHQDIQPIAINLASHDVDIVGSHLLLLVPRFLITLDPNPYAEILKAMLLLVRLDRFVTFHVNQNRYLRITATSCNKHSLLSIDLHLMSTTKLSNPSVHTCDTITTVGESHKVICV